MPVLSSRPLQAAALAATGLALAACNVHPGAAAVVGDHTISMNEADDAAAVYCQISLQQAQQQGGGSFSNADVRRQAVTSLVTALVALDVADQEKLRVDPASYAITSAQRSNVEELFPDDADQVLDVIESSQRTYAIALALGEKATGETSTDATEEQLVEIGHQEIQDRFAGSDVRFDPRFGLSRSGALKADTGSLSVTEALQSGVGAETLPISQQCRSSS